jgi:lipoprotein-anchoring transpeptidase ErfK/SrfK
VNRDGPSPSFIRRSLIAAVAVACTITAGCSGSRHHQTAAPAPSSTAVTPAVAAAPAAGWTLIATTNGTVLRYSTPGKAADGTIPGNWNGAVSALPVIGQQPGWLHVRLASRPNESTAWVRRGDTNLTATPYRIVINLSSKHLQLLRLGKPILNAPAAIGTATDPTPTGQYFVALFEQAPNPGYGPFVMVTSAHSNTITDWEQSGDALTAIHGPLGSDGAIGATGAAVSHGCIRLHIVDQVQLRQVPVGTPVAIVA